MSDKIITYENKILRKKSEIVKNIDGKIKNIIERMFDTMYQNNGIGLAAIQIGIPKKIIIIDTTLPSLDLKGIKPVKLALINPEIVEVSQRIELGEEGCLSVPNIRGNVYRNFFVVLKGITLEEREEYFKLYDLNARVAQHEIDHTNGILFIDKIEK
jgi:peptide deformylase